MAKKTPKSSTELQYDKERKRIQRFIKQAEKRGYSFSNDILPPKPKKITSASVGRLQKLTPEKLYSKAKYETESGEILSGKQGRAYERSKASPANKSIPNSRTKRKTKTSPTTSAPVEPKVENPNDLHDVFSPLDYEDDFTDIDTPSKPETEPLKEPPIPSPNIHDYDYNDLPKDEDIILDNMSSQIDNNLYQQMPTTPYNDFTLDDTLTQIADWTPSPHWTPGLTRAKEQDRNRLMSSLLGAIDSDGRAAVARRLEENANRINDLIAEILYGSGSKEGNFKDGQTQVNTDLAVFSSIIMGRSLTSEESALLTEEREGLEVNN